MADEIHAAAIEAQQCAARCPRYRAAGETRKSLRGLFDVGDGNDDVDQADGAVRMRQPALLPHRLFGVMGQHLDAAFRHHPGLDAGDGEGRGAGAGCGLDRARHVHQRPDRKAVGRETPVRLFRVGDGEGGEMQSGVARERRIEFAAQRRIGGLEQHLDIAARKHGGDVAGSGRAHAACGIGADLDRDRRRRKAAARKGAARRFGVMNEMGEMI